MSEEIKVSIPSTVFCLPHRFTVNVSVTVAPILTPNNPTPTPTGPVAPILTPNNSTQTPTGRSTPVTMSPIVFAGVDTTAELRSAGRDVAYSPTSTLISNDVASGHESPTGSPSGPPGRPQNEVYVTDDGHPSTISGPGVDHVLPSSPLIAPLARVLRDIISSIDEAAADEIEEAADKVNENH